jgi:hypothetical protein
VCAGDGTIVILNASLPEGGARVLTSKHSKTSRHLAWSADKCVAIGFFLLF